VVLEARNVTVAALAGRRIDEPDAFPARFPVSRLPVVRAALSDALRKNGVTDLVCSAACGADLIALAVAEELGIRRRIVLPFNVRKFRHTSVVDRPGDWGGLYDHLVDAARIAGDLIILNENPEDKSSFSRANYEIIKEATLVSKRALAILVWEGSSRGIDDVTEEFRRLALDAKFRVLTVKTC
jgi:hypothetical protein